MILLQTLTSPAAEKAAAETAAELASAKDRWEMLRSLPLDQTLTILANQLVQFVLHLIIAILVFYIGRFIIRKLTKFARTMMIHRRMEASLTTFIMSLLQILLYFILIVTVIGIIGLETSSFLAIFASAGVAIGMALSGTLQNFAGGVLILLLKPYKVGDYIEAQGFAGTVKEIQIFNTIIITYDNKSIILPNGSLSTGSINNWSKEQYRRVDWNVSLSYGNDVDVARKVMLDILHSDNRVVRVMADNDIDIEAIPDEDDTVEVIEKTEQDTPQANTQQADNAQSDTGQSENWFMRLVHWHHHRRQVAQKVEALRQEHRTKAKAYERVVVREPSVNLKEMADSAIIVNARAWTLTTDYWAVFYAINERFYKELPKAGLSFPFPQLDVHLTDPDPRRLTVVLSQTKPTVSDTTNTPRA